MKIAIMLTGLLIDKVNTLPHIKRMFDFISLRNNIEVDYYCHFWAPENMYPYNVDYHATKIVVPWENQGSIDYAKEVFNPINSKTSNYADILPYFNEYVSEISKHDSWLNDVFSDKTRYIGQDIHKRFFADNFSDPVYEFDKWWAYHINWCQFIHQIAQIYSTSESMKLVADSNINYDAVIRWRFDVLFDYKGFEATLVNLFRDIKNDNAFYTEIAWEGLQWKADLTSDINNDYNNKLISLHDGWWITNNEVNKNLANNYLNNYLLDMINTVGQESGIHTWHHNSVVRCNLPIRLLGRIKHTIIRFPEKIPHDWHNAPNSYYIYLWNSQFVAKKDSDFKMSLQYWDKRSQYHTIKHFEFY
jgi:hypothetical protein